MERQRADSDAAMMDFISHEIRGPVSVALAVLENGAVEDFASATLALQFTVELLNTHLDLSKCVAGELDLAPAIIEDVATDIVAPVVKMLEPRTRDSDVTKERVKLSIVAPEEKINAFIDPVRLKQILTNLIGNSIKFTPSPGYVEVKQELLIAVAATEGSLDQLIFSVTDSGVGIAPEERDQLFQKWHQLGKKSHQGSGVGLSLVKNLAEQMGGSVRYDSSYKGGSRFIVTIPRGDVAAAAIVSAASYVRESARETTTFHGRYKLLIVDDNHSMREILRHSMAKLLPQAEICVADSGEACLEIVAERGPFDVITMDYYLAPTIGSPSATTTSNIPVELNGAETISKLRGELKETAIIVGISANAKGAEFSGAGAELFWRKPIPQYATLGQELARHVALPKRLRVLLLDDERTALKLQAMQFKKERKEWEVVTCTTAGEFIAKVKGGEEPFDLYVLDEHLGAASNENSEDEDWTGSTLANAFLPRAGRKSLVVSRSGNSGVVGEQWGVFDALWVKGDRTPLGDQLKTLFIRSEAVALSVGVGEKEDEAMEDGATEDGAMEDGALEDGAKEDGVKEGGAKKRKMEVEGTEVRSEDAAQPAVSVPEVLRDMLTTYCDGDVGKLEEIASIIQEGLSSTVEEVRAAAKHATENPGEEEAARCLAAVAHKVKGTLKSVRLRAGETAGLLQEAVKREGISEGVREAAWQLVAELERLRGELEKFLAER